MANSKVLLLVPVENLGSEGDEVTVKAGYARNYLMPRNMAACITRANKKQVEALRKRREEREAQELGAAKELAGRLEKVRLAFAVKTGKSGQEIKLFGSVTVADVVKRLKEEGFEIEKKRVTLSDAHIKRLGQYSAHVKLHDEVGVDVVFEVVSENPIGNDNEGKK